MRKDKQNKNEELLHSLTALECDTEQANKLASIRGSIYDKGGNIATNFQKHDTRELAPTSSLRSLHYKRRSIV